MPLANHSHECVFPWCLHVAACCSVKLTGLGGQSRMLCEPRGPPARPPSYENTQTRAQALAAWSRSLYRASWSLFPSGGYKLHYEWRAVHRNSCGGGYGRSVVLRQDNNTTTQSDLLRTASEGILRWMRSVGPLSRMQGERPNGSIPRFCATL
jgi:hypothetical protein